MKRTKWVASLSLAVGVMMVGCGGAVPETEQESSNTETRQDALPDCSNPGAGFTIYYSDAAHTTEIGGRGCSCYTYYSWGKTSIYTQVVPNSDCH